MRLIKDLGMKYPSITSRTKVRYGLFICECGVLKEVRTQSVLQGMTSSCGCKYTKPSVPLEIKIIKDLGSIYATANSKKAIVHWLVECPLCEKHFRVVRARARRGKVKACRSCNSSGVVSSNKKTSKKYLEELSLLSNNIICMEKYVNTHVPILHKHCCGNSWKASPANILNGSGCPACTRYGFKDSEPAILYHFKVSNTANITAWKLGITNLTVEKRYSKPELLHISDIQILKFDKGYKAREAEKRLLAAYKAYKYQGEPLLYKGNTELLSIDITKDFKCMEFH